MVLQLDCGYLQRAVLEAAKNLLVGCCARPTMLKQNCAIVPGSSCLPLLSLYSTCVISQTSGCFCCLLHSDESAVEAMVEAVLAANPKQLQQYCGGKTKLAGFFTGQVMKESQGRVNPGLMNKVLMRKLAAAAAGGDIKSK